MNYLILRSLILSTCLVVATVFAIGCTAPNAYIQVGFDEDQTGEFTSTGKISSPILNATINSSTSASRPPKIQQSVVGNCNAFYSNYHGLSFDPVFPARAVYFKFAEYGGQNRVEINNEQRLPEDMIELHGVSGTDYSISVEAEKIGANWFGAVNITGQIDRIEISGQELLVDDIIFVAGMNAVPHRILLDIRTAFGSAVSSYSKLHDLLENNGYVVDIHTTGIIPPGTLDNYDIYVGSLHNHDSGDGFFGYDPGEPDRLMNFVSNGGAALLITEWGPSFSDPVYQLFLDEFDIQNGNNTVLDPVYGSFDGGKWVFYEKGRNFLCHPAIAQVNKVYLKAASTVNGSAGSPVIYTDTGATPSSTPVLFAKRFGTGRIAVIGDSDWISLSIDDFDHKLLALGIVDWISARRQ